jgi:hypothetical protein
MPPCGLPGAKTQSIIRDHGNNQIHLEGASPPFIHLQQDCGNEMLMNAEIPDIHVKQDCGNELHMTAGKGIELRDEYGNEIVMDSQAGTLLMKSPTHNSYIILGKSMQKFTDSDGVEHAYGNEEKFTQGTTKETFVGLKQSYNLAVTEEFFTGAKISQMTGAEIKTNISKEVSKNILNRERKAKGGILYDSMQHIHLIGGAGDESAVKLDASKAIISGKNSHITQDTAGGIQISAKKDIEMQAKNGLLIKAGSKPIVLKSKKAEIKAAIKQKNLDVAK